MAQGDGDRVELTDLDVIRRYSLAVRSATADRAEVAEALRADLAWIESIGPERSTASRTRTKKASTQRAAGERRS